MPNNHNYIISLCNQLAKAGKTPSLALIRNKSDRPLAIPDVIQALKSWKENPEQEVDVESADDNQPAAQPIEERVTLLEQQVKELQRLVKDLSKKS